MARPNVTVVFASPLEGLKFPDKLDLFWIAQNYHDLHDPFMGPVDMAAFNRAVYAALKPGGTYLVLDHVAAAGSPANVTDTLHRIEPSTVRREVEAAGFRFAGESAVLANPADPTPRRCSTRRSAATPTSSSSNSASRDRARSVASEGTRWGSLRGEATDGVAPEAALEPLRTRHGFADLKRWPTTSTFDPPDRMGIFRWRARSSRSTRPRFGSI